MALQTTETINQILLHGIDPEDRSSKDALHRVGRLKDWLDKHHGVWFRPDLTAYRDYLLNDCGLTPSSAKAHVSTIRGQYRRLLLERDLFFRALPDDVLRLPFPEQKAYVDELVIRLENAIHPQKLIFKGITKQDRSDTEHRRLTEQQAYDLLRAPARVHGESSIMAIRDTAILGLLLATGIRQAELTALTVDDLRQRLGGELALIVREGKGKKQRLIPYGDNDGVLLLVDKWLQKAGITKGLVFRSFDSRKRDVKQGLRDTGISVRSVQRIVKGYPIIIDGKEVSVRPHDLRRTYARREFEAKTDLIAIQQNLGHASLEKTRLYIGELNAQQRRGRAVYDWSAIAGG